MRRFSPRQLVLLACAVLLWLAGVVALLLGSWVVGAVALSTLLLLGCVLTIDSRAGDARVVDKVNRLVDKSNRLLRRADEATVEREQVRETVGREMRSSRRAVQEAADSSLQEIATFKLQLAAITQQLVEINHAGREVSLAAIDERLATLREAVDAVVSDGAAGVLEAVRDSASGHSAGAAQHRRELEQLKVTTRQVHSDLVAARREVARVAYEPAKEVEALLQLRAQYEPRDTMPLAGGWAMSSSGILLLTEMVRERRPGLVVECGSGASTLWLGHALRAQGHGRVVALEHEEDYASQVRSQVARHELQDRVTILHAPLVERDVDGEVHLWYSAEQTDELGVIDVLVVDGPPQSVGPWSRYPALPLLEGQLSADAVLVLDDASRADEQAVVQRWKDRRQAVRQMPFTPRHQAVLTGVGLPQGG